MIAMRLCIFAQKAYAAVPRTRLVSTHAYCIDDVAPQMDPQIVCLRSGLLSRLVP